MLFYDIYIRLQGELFIDIRERLQRLLGFVFYCSLLNDLIFGDKHETNEFFRDPELFLDLAPLLLLDMEGEAGERLGEAREEPRL